MRFVPVGKLDPHPLALECASWCGGAERDAAEEALAASVRLDGVKVPLAVAPKGRGAGFWVVDGCSRLAAAKAAGLAGVPCEFLPAMSDEALGEEVYARNTLRKNFTSGQRVMLYVETHFGSIAKTDRKGGRPKPGEDAPGFSAAAIAQRIGVDRHDVAAAIELEACYRGRMVPDPNMKGRPLRPARGEDEARRLDAARSSVVRGLTPVRRWLAAFEGMKSDEGGAAAAKAPQLGVRTMKSLRTVFSRWQDIRPADRQPVLDLLGEAVRRAPDDVVALLSAWLEERAGAANAAKAAGRAAG